MPPDAPFDQATSRATDDAGRPADAVAAGITRGVRRTFAATGLVSVTEFALRSGRRADILALDPKGVVTIVEVKSGPADFRADRKWPEYQAFCDRFFFAVGPDFPIELLPEDRGLIVADAWDAMIVREAPVVSLPAARRKAVLLRFAHAAAGRLHRLEDPRL